MDLVNVLRELAGLIEGVGTPWPFLMQYPGLFSSQIQEKIYRDIFTLNLTEEEHNRLRKVLLYIQQIQGLYESQPDKYPLGFGPIEKIIRRLNNGEIRADYAEELATRPEITQNISPLYIRVMSILVNFQVNQGNLKQAIIIHKLLNAAVQMTPKSYEQKKMQECIDWYWIDTAKYILYEIPDGRVLRDALAAGERLLDSNDKEDLEFKGKLMYTLGILYLDPYSVYRDYLNYDAEIQRWHERLSQIFEDEIIFVPNEELQMPLPQEALKQAIYYLRQAVELRSGEGKVSSIKALVQALELSEQMKLGNFQKEIIKLCRKASKLLDPIKNPLPWLAISGTLLRQHQKIDIRKKVEKVFNTSLDVYVQRFVGTYTIGLVQEALRIYYQINPQEGLKLSIYVRPLFKYYGDENSRSALWEIERRLMIKAMAAEIPDELPKEGIKAIIEQLESQMHNEDWDIDKFSVSLLRLANHSVLWNEESTALELLDDFARLTPILLDNHSEMLKFFRSTLLTNVAVNARSANDYPTAIQFYAKAIVTTLDLNLPNRLTDLLQRISNIIENCEEDVSIEVVQGLIPVMQHLETILGNLASDIILNLCKHTIKNMLPSFNPDILLLLLQTAKGMRFASVLCITSQYYEWHSQEQAMELLQQIQEAESHIDSFVLQAVTQKPLLDESLEPLLDKALLLVAYADKENQQKGDILEERLLNLQKHFDTQLNRHLLNLNKHPLNGVNAWKTSFMTTQDIQAALDERTVLLNYYIGTSKQNKLSIYLIVITCEDVKGQLTVTEDLTESTVWVGDKERRRIYISPFASTIVTLREQILQNPEPMNVSIEAANHLENNIQGYFGHFWEILEELNIHGKNHLCIVPHGPLHYLPFHLIGPPDNPLAERWIVTYLPNINLLNSRRRRTIIGHSRQCPFTAIALSFKDSKWQGLPILEHSLDEAHEVANIFGTEPILENKATKEAVLDALENSRYVHISTHGRHNVEAPAFHCLFLTPDDESNGQLHAYELLSLNLRGLELVTLSACETGLGRFDASDNLRGIPASLFLAGVSTIVVTLWDAEETASKHFFSVLYRELKAEKSKLDAFATAQRETRAHYPQYRDWGPFVLMGDWF